MTLEELVNAMWRDVMFGTVSQYQIVTLLEKIERGETYNPEAHATLVQQTKYVRELPPKV